MSFLSNKTVYSKTINPVLYCYWICISTLFKSIVIDQPTCVRCHVLKPGGPASCVSEHWNLKMEAVTNAVLWGLCPEGHWGSMSCVQPLRSTAAHAKVINAMRISQSQCVIISIYEEDHRKSIRRKKYCIKWHIWSGRDHFKALIHMFILLYVSFGIPQQTEWMVTSMDGPIFFVSSAVVADTAQVKYPFLLPC